MKLKYYMRGLGIGILMTALIMGLSLNGKRELSDEEIKERAAALGMVEESAVLLPSTSKSNESVEKEELENEPIENVQIEQNETDAGQEDDIEQTEHNYTPEKAVNYTPESAESIAIRNQAANKVAAQITSKIQADAMIREAEDAAGVAGSVGTAGSDAASTETTGADTADSTYSGAANADTSNEVTAGNDATVAQNETADEKIAEAENIEDKPAVGRTPATIVVESGNGSDTVSRKLVEAGLVENAEAFDKYLCNHDYDYKITVGKHTIPAGSTYDEIARILISAAE